MRTLYFQQITDDRFESEKIVNNSILDTLLYRVDRLKELLKIDGVNVEICELKKLEFEAEPLEKLKGVEKSYQYRVDFYITKTTRKISWNDIYKIVNSVKPVPYSFI